MGRKIRVKSPRASVGVLTLGINRVIPLFVVNDQDGSDGGTLGMKINRLFSKITNEGDETAECCE